MMGPIVNESTDPLAIRALDDVTHSHRRSSASIPKLVDEIFAGTDVGCSSRRCGIVDDGRKIASNAVMTSFASKHPAALTTPSRPSVDCLKLIPDFSDRR